MTATDSTPSSFVHLRLHTDYSLIDGINRVKKIAPHAAKLNMPALALTDVTNFFSLVKFFGSAKGAGVKPIFGADLWVENNETPDEPFRITFLCMNMKGYLNLTEIISQAYQENQHDEKAISKKAWIVAKNEGLIMLSGALHGDAGVAIASEKLDQARQLTQEWAQVFDNRYYIELQRTGRAGEQFYNDTALDFSQSLQLPVVATNDVVFMERKDFDAHETRVCITEGYVLADPKRSQRYTEEQYMKSPEEMAELFKDIPSALENTLEIAKRCSVNVPLGECFLPDFPIPADFLESPIFELYSYDFMKEKAELALQEKWQGKEATPEYQEAIRENVFFQKVSYEGLEWRFDQLFDRDSEKFKEQRPIYLDRIEFELHIIMQMGFPGYFLIVMDFIQWGKDQDIPIGPGRGSGAGSLVAYAQKITDLDPLEYDLLFERFLNPERVSMPDFDIDFCMDRREEVIAYVSDAYGKDAVSQIITFGTMAAKAVVRDVARVQGKSYGVADKMSKLIPADPGTNLQKAWDAVPELVDFVENDEDAGEIWDMSRRLEGTIRQTGKHAGGVVIAPTKLTDFSPLLCDVDGSGLVTQYDKNDVEAAGLVKFDFLGLRTLTIIDWALQMINPQRIKQGKEAIDIAKIPLVDEPSYRLLKDSNTTAVFQLESRGMKDLIRRLQPDNLEDLIALVALFRPGPLESGMVEDFINRKHGRAEVSYPHVDFQHECLKPILEPTYGVIVYQEQVMQIAQALAGYTLGGADMLRRAMGKKKPEEMAKQREIFREGAIGQGVDPDLAMKIFDLVEKFAGYGFNKSHSAAYAYVSYQTLWLKTHYPAPFMAAVMSADLQNTEKVVTLLDDCRENNIEVLLPDINWGEYHFTVNDKNQVIYGLGAVRGVGEGPIDAIVDARKAGGDFKDIFDFCERVAAGKVNKRVLEALIRSGAMDNIGPNRAVMFASIPDALKAAVQAKTNANVGMMDMFGELEAEANIDPYEHYKNTIEWSKKQQLAGEKDTLGLYLTGHPIEEYEKEVHEIVSTRLKEISPSRSTQTMAGLVVGMRTRPDKKGNMMAFVEIDDRTGRTEVAFFGEAWAEVKDIVKSDAIIVIEGTVRWNDYAEKNTVNASTAYSIIDARQKLASGVVIDLPETMSEKLIEGYLAELLSNKSEVPENCPVTLNYQRDNKKAQIQLGASWGIELDDEVLHKCRSYFGKKNVTIDFRGKQPAFELPEFGISETGSFDPDSDPNDMPAESISVEELNEVMNQ